MRNQADSPWEDSLTGGIKTQVEAIVVLGIFLDILCKVLRRGKVGENCALPD